MKKKNTGHVWGVAQTTAATEFNAETKAAIVREATEKIKSYEKLAKKVSRIIMRSNRLYLYELYEMKDIPEGAHLIKPLIDGKYVENIYGRITLYDTEGRQCTLECQRFNDQWMPLYNGTLSHCLNAMEIDNGWFWE